MDRVYFNRVSNLPNLKQHIETVLNSHILAGDGSFTKKSSDLIKKVTNSRKVLLTHSCTAALEMAALLADIKPGDEVIMPSHTFVSTANAFALRGASVIFIDCDPKTLNITPEGVSRAITKNTKCIVPVHYAGVSCDMDPIIDLAKAHSCLVVEDAAQGFMANYKGKMLGTIGDLGTYSFHETKNIVSGEGGSLLVNNPTFDLESDIVREKGTNRTSFLKGEVDKYTWQSLGSSYLPSDIIAAVLLSQLERAFEITQNRLTAWESYYSMTADLEKRGLIRRPIVPAYAGHNGHLFYVLLNKNFKRSKVLEYMQRKGVHAISHYVPLHSSPGGRKFGVCSDSMSITDNISSRLIRLPLYYGIKDSEQSQVLEVLEDALDFKF